jgi:hypothetical protein
VLPALLGRSDAAGRTELVLQNNGQAPLALRSGSWKLIERADGGIELYDLTHDLGETRDLAAAEPARVAALSARLQAIRGKDVPRAEKSGRRR